jgi:hypothetical protein
VSQTRIDKDKQEKTKDKVDNNKVCMLALKRWGGNKDLLSDESENV